MKGIKRKRKYEEIQRVIGNKLMKEVLGKRKEKEIEEGRVWKSLLKEITIDVYAWWKLVTITTVFITQV